MAQAFGFSRPVGEKVVMIVVLCTSTQFTPQPLLGLGYKPFKAIGHPRWSRARCAVGARC